MSKLTDQWIELFRAGDYGAKGKFTVQDLDRIAASYDPSFHEAPLVIGHPESNKPAYGWIDRLKRSGEVLLGKPKQVDPEFEAGVEAGRFKKRSVAFYKTPSGYSLRHVGFLGAKPPDVKGLADAVFHDQDTEVIEVTFEEDSMQFDEKGFFERLGAWLKDNLGTARSAEVKTFSEDDVKRIAADAAKTAAAEAVKPLQTTIAEQQLKIVKFEEDGKAAKTATAATAAIDKLKAAGKWLPAFDKMGVALVFDELAKSTETVEFGEGADKKKVSPVEVLASFFDQLPKIVPTGKIFETKKIEFAEDGSRVNSVTAQASANSSKLHSLASARAKEKSMSYGDALSQVARENPSLTQPGAPAGGSV